MLSPSLQALVRSSETNDHIDISTLEKGAVISIETDDTVFSMVVAQPENGAVVVSALMPELLEPTVCIFQGATNGGSAVEMHHIVIGMMMRMNPPYGLLITSRVKEFAVVKNDDMSKRYLDVWQKEQEQPPLDVEMWNSKIASLVEKDFKPENHKEIRDMLSQFNPEGQGMMLGILYKAKEKDIFDKAMQVIAKHFDEHWQYMLPSMRGSFIRPSDIQCIQAMYRDLDLELPEGG